MSQSQTVQATAERHRRNEDLQAPFLRLAARSPQDLSIEYPSPAPAAAIIQGAARALEEGNTHYVPVPGIDPLRAALAGYLGGLGIAGWGSANVVVTAGVQEARFLTIQMIGVQFGQIALPEVVHPGARQAAGVRKLDISTIASVGDRGLPSPDSVRALLEAGQRLFYFESPSRLTGAAFDSQELAELARLLEEFDGYAIVDQGLLPWSTGQSLSLAAQPGMAERVAVIGEAWPGSGLESWQVGYIGAKEEWVAPVQKQKQIMSICTSTPSQFAALAAAEGWEEAIGERREALSASRAQVLEALEGHGAAVLPGEVASFVAVRSGASLVERLEALGYEVADGADFGAPGVFRLAVASGGVTESVLQQLNGG